MTTRPTRLPSVVMSSSTITMGRVNWLENDGWGQGVVALVLQDLCLTVDLSADWWTVYAEGAGRRTTTYCGKNKKFCKKLWTHNSSSRPTYLHEFASVASAAAARLNAEAIDAGAVVGRQRLYLEGARWYRVCTLLDAGTTISQLRFLKRKNSETSQFHLLLSDVGLYTCTIWLSLYLGSEFTKHLTTNIVFVPFWQRT